MLRRAEMITPFDPSSKEAVEKFLFDLDSLLVKYGSQGITNKSFHGIFSFCAQIQLNQIIESAKALSDSINQA